MHQLGQRKNFLQIRYLWFQILTIFRPIVLCATKEVIKLTQINQRSVSKKRFNWILSMNTYLMIFIINSLSKQAKIFHYWDEDLLIDYRQI